MSPLKDPANGPLLCLSTHDSPSVREVVSPCEAELGALTGQQPNPKPRSPRISPPHALFSLQIPPVLSHNKRRKRRETPTRVVGLRCKCVK